MSPLPSPIQQQHITCLYFLFLFFLFEKNFKIIFVPKFKKKLVLPSLIPVATINTINVKKNQQSSVTAKNGDTIIVQNGKTSNSSTTTITVLNRCKQSPQRQQQQPQSEKRESKNQMPDTSNGNIEIAKDELLQSPKQQISLVKSTIKKLSSPSPSSMSNQRRRIYHSSMDIISNDDDKEDEKNEDKMVQNKCPLIKMKKCQRSEKSVSFVVFFLNTWKINSFV